jgi:guanylate kinase
VIVSGPSGAGKTTVLERVLARCPVPLVRSVSATTRPARPGEKDRTDYYFLSVDDFLARRARGEFLESCRVYADGDWYGTIASEVHGRLAAGAWVVLAIDVQGAREVLARHPDALTIFVHPGSAEELEHRLRARGTESDSTLDRRLAAARRELDQADRYRWQVVNDDPDRAAQEISDILVQEWRKAE